MSQHLFSTTHNGECITVMMGWDRPMQGYFLIIERDLDLGDEAMNLDDPDLENEDDNCQDDFDLYVYCNLYDPCLKGGITKDFGYYYEKLKELNIEVPTELLENVYQDAGENAGNKFVNYSYLNGNLVVAAKEY